MIPEARPKLLLFSHLCSPNFVTGAEKLLILFARVLNRRYRCVLVVPREGVIAAEARSLGIPVIVFDIPLCVAMYSASPFVNGHLDGIRSQFVYQRLLALLIREHPSCVFVNTCVHPLPAIAAKSLGIPVIWGLMEMIQPSPHRHLTLDIIAGASDVIAGISRTTLQPFHRHAAANISCILSPYVSEEEWDPAAWPIHRQFLRQISGWAESDCVIGYVAGAIYPQKGLEPFIRAALLVGKRNPHARFLVVGTPVDEQYFLQCQRLVSRAGMAGRFGWIRFVEDVQRIYPAMDIAVVSSLQPEGFGMTALEAMMFGKPVVAFSSGGLAEILKATGNQQFLVPAGHVEALAERVGELALNEGLRRSVGEANALTSRLAYGAGTTNQQWDQLAARLQILPALPSPLIRAGRTVYLLEYGRRRPFVSEKAFLQRGFRHEDVRMVTLQELNRIPLGNSISEWPETAVSGASASRRRRQRKRSRKPGASRRTRKSGTSGKIRTRSASARRSRRTARRPRNRNVSARKPLRNAKRKKR